MYEEFSFRTRNESLTRFGQEEFDLLVIGGGITGAATARDAISRGLKVALVDQHDFAWGTSSRSSKLIHGGLRYLENLEMKLVFEALTERAHLLDSVPHMVRPLEFYLPVYKGDSHGKNILSLGLWLYDILALFRTPGRHRRLSKKEFLSEIPSIKKEGLQGGFRYYDASMWDDVLAVETLRSAHSGGAAIANYVRASRPILDGEKVVGYELKDLEPASGLKSVEVRAARTVVCAGPWTDHFARGLDPNWQPWLSPSKGVHLVFDHQRFPVKGALVMSHPTDGRISFVIPRKDLGSGVVIVGTTDGPSPDDPEKVDIERSDVEYLLELLSQYFPELGLATSDILSAYVGVRPLVGATTGSEGQRKRSLQKVSREHHIEVGPGGVVLVAGGKYTTHRAMAEEIVNFTLKSWKKDAKKGRVRVVPTGLNRPTTQSPLNIRVTAQAIKDARVRAERLGWDVPHELWDRYGAEAIEIMELSKTARAPAKPDPDGFPHLESQLRHLIRTGMVLHLSDFYLRRLPLFMARADHGWDWAPGLADIWAEELGRTPEEKAAELVHLKQRIDNRSRWQERIRDRVGHA